MLMATSIQKASGVAYGWRCGCERKGGMGVGVGVGYSDFRRSKREASRNARFRSTFNMNEGSWCCVSRRLDFFSILFLSCVHDRYPQYVLIVLIRFLFLSLFQDWFICYTNSIDAWFCFMFISFELPEQNVQIWFNWGFTFFWSNIL